MIGVAGAKKGRVLYTYIYFSLVEKKHALAHERQGLGFCHF